MKLIVAMVASALLAAAQDPPPTQPTITIPPAPKVPEPTNASPKVEFTCTPEDVEAFGLTCSPEEPCPVFLELSAVEAIPGRVFLTGNLHTATTTMFGLLLISEDGGSNWKEPDQRIRYGSLEHIQFLDLEYGWISGHINQPLPRDPFLLQTTDGGKSWRARPVYDDQHYGSVQQFWFESRTNGQLIVDRTQRGKVRQDLMESQTGGDSWDPKEVSEKQLQLKKSRPPGESIWRIRADAASQTLRVERRGADKWEPVAVFPIQAGECK